MGWNEVDVELEWKRNICQVYQIKMLEMGKPYGRGTKAKTPPEYLQGRLR